MNRLTLGGGIRLDMQNESTEAFTAGPHQWAPNRNSSFAGGRERAQLEGHRSARPAAYDLFGNGKTALKASVSRGVEQDSIRYASANNPALNDHHDDQPRLERHEQELRAGLQPDDRRGEWRVRRLADRPPSARRCPGPCTPRRSWKGGACVPTTGSSQ